MFIYLFIRERPTERQRHRQREKQAPRKEPDVGFNPGPPGSRPEPKVDVQPLRRPGVPEDLRIKCGTESVSLSAPILPPKKQRRATDRKSRYKINETSVSTGEVWFIRSFVRCIKELGAVFRQKYTGRDAWVAQWMSASLSAQGGILKSKNRVPHRAPCMEPAFLSLCLS